jgi:uncharacterized protein DUF5681
VPEGNEATRFKRGQSGNPKGRPKGSRHKISEAFLSDLLDHYQKHGFEAIDRMRKEDPTAYVRMVASFVSKQIGLKESTEQSGGLTIRHEDALRELDECQATHSENSYATNSASARSPSENARKGAASAPVSLIPMAEPPSDNPR